MTTSDPPLPSRPRRRKPIALADSLTHRLHRLQKLTDRVTQAAFVEASGLALGEARCLTAVGAFAPLSVQDLARRANVDKAQASRAAKALEAKGLLIKAPSAHDARGVVLTFTPAGQALWHRLMEVVAARNQAIAACLSADERAQFSALLDRLLEHAAAAAAHGSAAGAGPRVDASRR